MEIGKLFEGFKLLDKPAVVCPTDVQKAIDAINATYHRVKFTPVVYFGNSNNSHLLVCKSDKRIVLVTLTVQGTKHQITINPIDIPEEVHTLFTNSMDSKIYTPIAYVGQSGGIIYVLCQENDGNTVYANMAELYLKGGLKQSGRLGGLGYAFTWLR